METIKTGKLSESSWVTNFSINGKQYEVPLESSHLGNFKLVDFIRDTVGLKGTKYMCREGGCGACVIAIKSKLEKTIGLNSCLVRIPSAHGWEITTIEGLGGYHKIQNKFVSSGATQCGFCTPGLIMSRYASHSKSRDCLDGNLCRCTGYRSILEACEVLDIEDIPCPMPAILETIPLPQLNRNLVEGKHVWIRPDHIEGIYSAIQAFQPPKRYMIIAGGTGTAVQGSQSPTVPTCFIDINGVRELQVRHVTAERIKLGAGLTIANAAESLSETTQLPGYDFVRGLSGFLRRIGNNSVRNIATLGGNLFLKKSNANFVSDLYTILVSIRATVGIGWGQGEKEMDLEEFLSYDMNGKLLLCLYLPTNPDIHFLTAYKIKRANFNAAVVISISPDLAHSQRIQETTRIVFGGTAGHILAKQTQETLNGQELNEKTLQNAIRILAAELSNAAKSVDPYKTALAQGVLYKSFLHILGTRFKSFYSSGSRELILPIDKKSRTSPRYFVSKELESYAPLFQPTVKIEARLQVSGAAEFIGDIPPTPLELFGALILSTQGPCCLSRVDISQAILNPGVTNYIDAKQIPAGRNNFAHSYSTPEQILAQDKILYAGQPIGLILATTKEAAFAAVKLVELSYSQTEKPLLNMCDAIVAAAASEKKESVSYSEPKVVFQDTILIKGSTQLVSVQGEFEIGAQYHMHMETQTVLCTLGNGGAITVYSATQCPTMVQTEVSMLLGIPENKVQVIVPRLGGSYGGKASRSVGIACLAALGTWISKRPVRIVLPLATNMKMMGKRLPHLLKYDVVVEKENGRISQLNATLFCDAGSNPNESTAALAKKYFQNCYDTTGWSISTQTIFTNTPPNTFCRAPGTAEGIASIEYIMEHIAQSVNLDSEAVRLVNFKKDENSCTERNNPQAENQRTEMGQAHPLEDLIEELKISANYLSRKDEIHSFNEDNRWKKRGLSLVPMRYPLSYFAKYFPVHLSIYSDGTVWVSHGGVEMGQGINTKVAQTVASVLSIPLSKVAVGPASTTLSPNTDTTGASMSSELVCQGAYSACKKLLKRLEPVRKQFMERTKDCEMSWEKLILEACKGHVCLSVNSQSNPTNLKDYNIWGASIVEVEIDVLTGEYIIVRVDLLEDTGTSINPNVDLGQIEGAFVMGLGLWTSEKISYEPNSGALLTCNTFKYTIPSCKDIPEQFNVRLRQKYRNPFGFMGSKATGEPALCLAVAVVFAVRQAINSARNDVGNEEWYQLNGPITPQDVHRLCLVSPEQHFRL